MLNSRSIRTLAAIAMNGLVVMLLTLPVNAGAVDSYVLRYLRAREPVPLMINSQGETRLFSPEDLTQGKRLFEENCINCHVGGSTLPDPTRSLKLATLKGAVPPRDNIESLLAFQREPMDYDGSDDSVWCRRVSEDWMSTQELTNLEAFILRAAEIAPAWGQEDF